MCRRNELPHAFLCRWCGASHTESLCAWSWCIFRRSELLHAFLCRWSGASHTGSLCAWSWCIWKQRSPECCPLRWIWITGEWGWPELYIWCISFTVYLVYIIYSIYVYIIYSICDLFGREITKYTVCTCTVLANSVGEPVLFLFPLTCSRSLSTGSGRWLYWKAFVCVFS